MSGLHICPFFFYLQTHWQVGLIIDFLTSKIKRLDDINTLYINQKGIKHNFYLHVIFPVNVKFEALN